jgi:hypothetical protein
MSVHKKIGCPICPVSGRSFEPYVEFVPYSTRVLGSNAGRKGGVLDDYITASLIAGFRSLDARPPAPTPSTHCWLEVCAAVLADSPSVTSIGLISGGHEIVTFVSTAFGRDRHLINRTRA